LAPEGVCAREIPCVNQRVFRLSAPAHKALPRPVEPTRALVSGEAELENCWRSTMAVQALCKREVAGSTPAASTNCQKREPGKPGARASVAQLAGGASLRRKTVWVRIPPDAPMPV